MTYERGGTLVRRCPITDRDHISQSDKISGEGHEEAGERAGGAARPRNALGRAGQDYAGRTRSKGAGGGWVTPKSFQTSTITVLSHYQPPSTRDPLTSLSGYHIRVVSSSEVITSTGHTSIMLPEKFLWCCGSGDKPPGLLL